MTADAAAERRPTGSSDVPTERHAARSVLVEVVIAAVVLGATAVLVGQPRGAEALASQDRAAVSAVRQLGGGRHGTVTVDPGGTARSASPWRSSAAPADAVTATATQPAKQLGPIPCRWPPTARTCTRAQRRSCRPPALGDQPGRHHLRSSTPPPPTSTIVLQ